MSVAIIRVCLQLLLAGASALAATLSHDGHLSKKLVRRVTPRQQPRGRIGLEAGVSQAVESAWSLGGAVLNKVISTERMMADTLDRALSPRQTFDAYVIGHMAGNNATVWKEKLNGLSSSVVFSDRVDVDAPAIEQLLKENEIDVGYHSRFVPNVARGVEHPTSLLGQKFVHELGCTLAHRQVWRQFVKRYDASETGPWALVLEGDAIPRHDFTQRITELQSQLSSVTSDIVFVGHCYERCLLSSTTTEIDVGGDVHVVPSQKAVCTHAYLVSAGGAKRLLDLTMPIQHALDENIRSAYNNGTLKSLSVCPPIARQPWQTEAEMLDVKTHTVAHGAH